MSATPPSLDDWIGYILHWLRASGGPLPIPPATDDYGDETWREARDQELAAVAVLRDRGLVEISTESFPVDWRPDDPGVTIYVHLLEAPDAA